ncbi:TrkA C-terminal domain-containing protein [Rhodococcoides kroppenstedtii]|uniref:TrkA C-terminal domain-containing protein n=1 Tax=Rhodococcoides kroppenstedtii TaxID=293050 RepID=UPI00352FF7CA
MFLRPPTGRNGNSGRRRSLRTSPTPTAVTVVAIKRPGRGFTYATADTVIEAGDTIIVSGQVRDAERFSELT